MLKQGKNSIEFDVNEILYFETGQEIDEMLSISLDPDIAIQTYDDYIQIRGIVLLQGEYKRAQFIPNRSVSLDENEFTRFIEKVYEMDDERTRFSHRFPVEISVPPYLVENLDDITVTVDAFDYELPDQNKLKINSSIHIHGIKKDAHSQENTLADEQETPELTSYQEDFWREEEGFEEQMSRDTREQNHETAELSEVVEEEVQQVETVSNTETADFYEDEEMHETDAIEEIDLLEERTAEQVQEMESLEGKETNEIDIQLNESKADEGDEEVKDVQFLTDLFGGEEEESYTKMRIYITQEDDSIESIAKKYEMSALQLIKDNNLSGESLEEGQLLYIPVKANQE